jgi:large subunit ribosomal protein L35Ae
MEGLIVSFRRGRRTQYNNQFIIKIPETDKEKAKSLLSKKVIWTSKSGKKINGTIMNIHGNKGALRARFERGLPGQAVGTRVEVK